MMVTVAKSLDVPIKLMFPRPAAADDPSSAPSHAMLGLGDVVLPGIMIGLALRFDLYLFYLRRQKRIPAAVSGEEEVIEKPKYHSLAGRWSDHFWTHSLTGRPLWVAANVEAEPEAPFTFPKTYFNAGLVGYILGLLATLGVMMVWNHAQPALLYLVPGVLGSVWLTALVRGEINLMLDYTEEIEDEEAEAEKKKTEQGKESKAEGEESEETSKDVKARRNRSSTDDASPSKSDDDDDQETSIRRAAAHRPDREVFSFSIEAPWQLKSLRSVPTEEEVKRNGIDDAPLQIDGKKHTGVLSKSTAVRDVGAEPAGKRVRLK